MNASKANLQDMGNKLITGVTGVLKAFELYDATNSTVTKLLQNICNLLEEHEKSHPGTSLRLQCDGENFFLNQELLRLDRQSFERASKLLNILQGLNRNELEFRPELDIAHLRDFMVKLSEALEDKSILGELEDGAESGISLRFVEGTTRQGRDSVEVRAEAGARFYVTLQILSAEYLALTGDGKRPSMMAIRRTLQRLIDLIQLNRDSVLAMVHYGRYRHGLEGHVSRTALLAGCLAHTMGLDRRWISTVCLYVFPAMSPLIKLDDYWSSPTRGQAQEAYGQALATPSKSTSVGAGVVRDLIAQYETGSIHERKEAPFGEHLRLSLAGRIVALAAAYDAMRANLMEGDRCRPISPKEVLMSLEEMKRTDRLPLGLDPDLIGVLIQMMGSIPPGSLVRLENGACGIVRERPNTIQMTDTFGRYLTRPRITKAKKATPLSPPLGLDMGPVLAWSEET